MIGGKSQARHQPQAFGSLLSAGVYGATIPVIIGTTKSAPLPIWAQNLRSGVCIGKKGKKAKKGKGPPQYVENIDLLIGHNPITAVLQFWANSTKYPMNFLKYSTSSFSGGSTGESFVTIPDAHFAVLIAVTYNANYTNVNFNDYGAPAAIGPLSGTAEIPLWNVLQAGPDFTNASSYRRYPWSYRWKPSYGATVYFDSLGQFSDFCGPIAVTTLNFYYAQVSSQIGNNLPSAELCLTFEPQLGDGSEYANYSSQRIVYPEYAGLGSPDFDLGSSGTFPVTKAEVLGSFPTWPTGDADFADMIEYVMKSGQIQAGLAPGANDVIQNTLPVQHGVNCVDFPGCIQKKYLNMQGGFGVLNGSTISLTFDLACKKNNYLIVISTSAATGATPFNETISDTNGNTWTSFASLDWTPSGGQPGNIRAWYCQNKADIAENTVLLTASQSLGTSHQRILMLEVGGLDTLDSVTAVATGTNGQATVSVTTTNTQGQPDLILAFGIDEQGVTNPMVPNNEQQWTDFVGPLYEDPPPTGTAVTVTQDFFAGQWRIVRNPGTYTWTGQTYAGSTPASFPWLAVAFAFKNSTTVFYPKPLGNILDDTTMRVARQGARAGGLKGSIAMNSQRKAADWLTDFYDSMNAWPVWSGFTLKSIAKSEVSAIGNGAVFTSPTAGGPVANLSDLNGDFVGDGKTPPVTVKRKAAVDSYNLIQIQHINRSSDYNQIMTSQPEPGSIALYGWRKAAPIVRNEIQDPTVARQLLWIKVREQIYLRNTYEFSPRAKWFFLEAGDLITITESLAGITNLPVRIISVEEDQKRGLKMVAEPFVYGTRAPNNLTASVPTPYQPNVNVSPGSINPPVIFQPPPRMTTSVKGEALMFVVSSSNANYGGSIVEVSTDGGNTYNSIGVIRGNGITGYSTADWPAAADPDTTHDLPVDLTESNGVLQSYAVADEDNLTYPCYVAGGSSTPGSPGLSQVVSGALAATTYFVRLTYVNAAGETLPGDEASLAVSVNNVLVVASPSALAGMTGYNVYVSTASGTETKQNGSPIAIGTPWQEPNSGLIAGSAMPTVDTSANIPYELMTYAVATLTATSKYTLKATGGNHLRRAAYGAPTVGQGVFHPTGARFAFLGPPEASIYPGVLQVPLDPKWIGVTLHFKFLAFNIFGGAQQSLSQATDYLFTPIGTIGTSNSNWMEYSISGGALTNPTSTSIAMAQATATWADGHQSIYNARTFTIAAPSVPTTYYVTILDPAMLGDQPGMTNLQAQCQTSNALVGKPGYVYIGSIVALAAGGGTVTTPGGVGGPANNLLVTVNGV